MGVFLFTTSTQDLGTQAVGSEVPSLVADGIGGGLEAVAGAADATTAVCAVGKGARLEGPVVAAGAVVSMEGPLWALFRPLLC